MLWKTRFIAATLFALDINVKLPPEARGPVQAALDLVWWHGFERGLILGVVAMIILWLVSERRSR